MARSKSHSAIRTPLTMIFGVDSNVGILRELVRHGGFLSSAEIQDRSGLSKTVVRLGLLSLQRAGIVITEGALKARLHRFNTAHYFAPQIAALYEAEKDRFAAILDSIRESAGARRPEIRSLWVYGSVARKEDGPDSDLDIALIAGDGNPADIVETVRENLRLPGAKLGFSPNVVGLQLDDIARLARDADPWWTTATHDAIVLLGERPEDISFRQKRAARG